MEEVCTALCAIDKSIEVTTFLALGGLALTLAIFLSSTITQIEFTHRVGVASGLKVEEDERHNLAQRKIALKAILFAWWISVVGLFYSLGIDAPNLIGETNFDHLKVHAHLIQEFADSSLEDKLDVGGSILLTAISTLSLSFSVWLMFPEQRRVLKKKVLTSQSTRSET